MFVWSTVIYDPIACWTWNATGWVYLRGGLDFAGGTPVHISSGCAALAYSIMLGKRRGHGTHELNYRPHNVTHIVIGTVFLWVGWFGFNAGSAMAANLRAVMAAVVTNLAACVGGITWCVLDYRLERKWSTVGFCSGVVAGLVAITPGSGFVPAWAAVIYGVVGAAGANVRPSSSSSLPPLTLSSTPPSSSSSLVSMMPSTSSLNTPSAVSSAISSLPSSLRIT
jgi:Amt family ammonium transporter